MPREVKCPNCRKETPWENNPHRPFCSERCRLIDLGAWAQERYRVPAEQIDASLDDDEGDDGENISGTREESSKSEIRNKSK